MTYRLAERTSRLSASHVRTILSLAAKPDVIAFTGGMPAQELFPVDELKKASVEVLSESGGEALQYNQPQGYAPLRRKICCLMKDSGIDADPENVLVTSGSQQGIDLTAKLFLEKGDTVICEGPTYLAALNVFSLYMANVVHVAMDESGMDTAALERTLQLHPEAKLIYTIPDFQNPTGRTMSLERRRRLVELANRYDVLIVEDNPYGAIRYSGTPLPALKHFDTEGRVVHLGTFSKILSPGLRVGWLCAPAPIMDTYTGFKQMDDVHTNIFAQMIADKYLENNDLTAHLKQIRKLYKRRKDIMVQSIETYFPDGIKHSDPQGGLFIWVELPESLDAQDVFKKCVAHRVAFVPGGPFAADGTADHAFRMSYANMTEEKIIEGMKRIGAVLTSIMAGKPSIR